MTEITYQLYSSRNFPPLAETLAMLKALGYAAVEGYGGLFATEADVDALERALGETGLKMPTVHLGLDEIEDDPGAVVRMAERLGVARVFCPHIGPELRGSDAAGWRAFGARLEAAGAPLREAGLGFGWHNHDFEFVALPDGTVPMAALLEGGPSLAWEADVAWIVRGGADPFAWIERFGDRMVAVHVKDIAAAGENLDEDGWADLGQGTVDWPGLVAALEPHGVAHWVIEHDNPSDDRRFAERSIQALRGYLGD